MMNEALVTPMVEVLLTVWALSQESSGVFRTFDGSGKAVKVTKLFPRRLHSALRKAVKDELIVADEKGIALDDLGCVELDRAGYGKAL